MPGWDRGGAALTEVAPLPGERSDATPFWFGPKERPLFGWLHRPAGGAARGGVVLCQALGIEATCVYYTYRLLADRLADLGLAVVRFDYDGTGDSYGAETDPDRLTAWRASVAAATDVLVDAGISAVGLVGIRVGALFAADEAARRGGVDALVLWDPSVSGRAFVREQRFLREVSDVGDRGGDDAVEAPGIRFEPETVHDLSRLGLPDVEGALARQVLVLVPPGTSRPRSLLRHLKGSSVEWQEATGEDRLLDSRVQAPPLQTIERVASWLSTNLGDRPVAVAAPESEPAIVAKGDSAHPVVERTVRLGQLGLFGIVTEGDTEPGAPTVLLVNEGNTHHIGQARIWVDLARELAAVGLRTLRFDLSGNGDSGRRPRQRAHVSRAPEAIADVREAAAGFLPDAPLDVVLIGFCSGAYTAVEQALEHPTRGLCIVNPTFSFVPPEPLGSHPRPARQVTRKWFEQLVDPLLRWYLRRHPSPEGSRSVRALHIGTWPAAIATRYPRVPEPVWRFVNRFLLEHQGAETLQRLVDSGVDTLVISCESDFLPIALGSSDRIAALDRSDRFRLVKMDELGHASWRFEERMRLVSVLVAHLRETYGSARPAVAVPAGSAASRPTRHSRPRKANKRAGGAFPLAARKR